MALFDPMTQDTRDRLADVEAAMGGAVADVDNAFAALRAQLLAITTASDLGLKTAALSHLRAAHLLMRYGRSNSPNYAGTPAEDAGMSSALAAALMATYASNGGAL